VFVIGAGPSGLAAAHRLRTRGFDVVVLERRDRVGGQLLTVKQDGFVMETGATVLPEAYSAVMELVEETGMRGELIPSNSLMGFVRDDRLHLLRADNLALDAARTKLLSTRAKLQVRKLAWDALRIGRLLSYEDLSIASAYDVESPAAYAHRRGLDGELYDYLIEPTVRAGAGVPGDVISVVEFFFLWQKVLGTKLYAFRDGYSSFMQRLADPLDVRLGVTVNEVVERADGVEVSWSGPDGDHTMTGAGTIVSSMGNEVPDLLPQLEPERAAFLRNLKYTSCININLGLSREPANMPASFVVFPRPSSDALFAIIAEHNKAPAGRRRARGWSGCTR
jgi:oxygen-dependent protoporphyrinogen oxidase